MSARPCGCDDAAGWICKQHGDAMEATRVERFQQRLANEDTMKDTTATDARFGECLKEEIKKGIHPFTPQGIADTIDAAVGRVVYEQFAVATPAEQFRADAVAVANAVETRDALLNRIATLERDLFLAESRNAQTSYDVHYLLNLAQHDADVFKARVALALKTFYCAPVSLSSVQPVIDLAVELNPGLEER